MNRDQIAKSIAIVRHFINDSLGVRSNIISGFQLSEPLLDAAAYNTYIETVGNKADTIYSNIKESMNEIITHSYIDYIRRLSEKFNWKEKKAMLAFDYTDEDFYGEVQGIDIYGWTGEHGVKGKFKFLTCSLISDDIQEKIPLVSIPVSIGHDMSHAVIYCMKLIDKYIGEIQLILFDRWYYAKEFMYNINTIGLPFLILAKKQQQSFIEKEFSIMKKGERKIILHEYEFSTNKTNTKFQTNIALLKKIFNKKLDKEINWVFATNVEDINLENIIQEYTKRWRIEVQFRIQDEARIKCKSKEMKIRYFIFAFEQLLQTLWACFYKEEVSFKEFIIEMHKVNKELVANPRKNYGKA